ncbi:activator of HSP90 ATPase [Mesorhizobium sp. 131-3-5]|uniref:SRPBCC family protein n=1 Tax=Mesorhizobium sp. 131-3-5 TaxID=2744520 RepID=UPI001928473E|nr:SRPBCC domain-containing protein [Mesorhizobium sp. 131-3-5]BCH08717.1 activator of HSP90 ATPase [Mesorhizobium sp. 131-3-5]
MTAPATTDRSFAIERIFNAPVERVFRLWTDPLLVAQWWGIRDCTIPLCVLDVRVGGCWRIDMLTASGALYRNQGSYLEVVENARLSYHDEPDPEIREWAGKPPGRSRHTVSFTPDGARTHVHFEVTLATAADRERLLALGMRGGWMQSFDRLELLIGKGADDAG